MLYANSSTINFYANCFLATIPPISNDKLAAMLLDFYQYSIPFA